MDKVSNLGWWAISGEDLMALLRRVEAGENPNAVYLEVYANSEHCHCQDGRCGGHGQQ
jgi:hypothetical protein